jgi:hypothetical protein
MSIDMAETITLQLSDTVADRAREIAVLTDRAIEEVLLEWIDNAAAEFSIESLSDDRVLALCDLQMESEQQATLSDLLARNRERQLDRSELEQLDALMQIYRSGLVRKAKAFKVAVSRGLRTMAIEA